MRAPHRCRDRSSRVVAHRPIVLGDQFGIALLVWICVR
jgi:hypothetical protein